MARCLWSRWQRRQLWFRAAQEGRNEPSWERLGALRRENFAGMTQRMVDYETRQS
jgi:hypothetical protein